MARLSAKSALTSKEEPHAPKPSKLAVPVRSRSPAPRVSAAQTAC
jgi:hypothetical protein